jgi:CubicO group peptidase (beta-lactamase class C family)
MNIQRAIHSILARNRTWLWPFALALVAALAVLQAAGPASLASAATARASTIDIARIDAFVSEQVQRDGIPGVSLGLVEGDQIIHLQGFGKADQTGRAITPQTPFILASVSKPVTALAIMQLVEVGKIDLDAPVQRYLPAFRVADPVASAQITVRNLLQHTTALPATECQSRNSNSTLEQYVGELRNVKLTGPVGAAHDYCSGNYNVLGRIVEVVSGESFADYMQQHVFAPLQMRHSYATLEAARQDNLAQTYTWMFGAAMPVPTYYIPSQVPSGYLSASAEDMCHFLIAQLNDGRYGDRSVLSPSGIAAMQAPGVPTPQGELYGLGLVRSTVGGVPIIHHDGVHANTRTYLFFEPQTRRGAVLLINSWGIVAAPELEAIEAGVVRLLAGQDPAPASSLSLPTIYLILDAVMLGILSLALLPLLRMRRWNRRWQQNYLAGRPRWALLGLRLAYEIGVPVLLLIGLQWVLDQLGAQSWYEGLTFLPELVSFACTLALLMLLAAALRAAIVFGALRRATAASNVRVSPSAS